MESLDTKIIVALISVFISFISLIISKEQKTSEFRQAWINTLRDDISKFIGQVDSIKKLILLNKVATEKDKKETSDAVVLDSIKLREIKSKIELLINPKEDKHIQLVQLLNQIVEEIKKNTNLSNSINELTKLAQKIFKEEWDRVKNGEPIYKFSKWTFGLSTLGIILYTICKLLWS